MNKKQAFEALRARQEEGIKNAAAALSLEEQERLVDGHKLGTNIHGWENPYPKDDPRSLLLQYQHDYINDGSRFKAWLASRQVGKDFTGEGEAVIDCYETPKSQWMVAAPSERQALDSLEQAKLWADAFEMKIADFKEEREGSHSQTLLKSAEIIFPNGERIRAVPGKPDTVRGRSANVKLTEFDFFEDPAATWKAILPSITNPLRGGQKKVRLVTTPNGVGSAMHKIWTKKPTAKMAWSKHLTTIYNAVLCGLPVDIAEIREAMDDDEGFQQEFLCQFLDTSNVLLPYDIIALAESFDATETWDLGSAGTSHPTFCGVDFGRQNDPTVCWTLQRVGDILWTREVLVLEQVSTPQQEQILRDRIRAAEKTSFDYTGPGIGLGDYLAEAHGEYKPDGHHFGKVELCTFTTGFKRELFPRLRRTFEAPTKLRIPVNTIIREDLHQMRQIITNGQYNYWSPRTKDGHSDRCTALALAVRAAGDGTTYCPKPQSNKRTGSRSKARRNRSVQA